MTKGSKKITAVQLAYDEIKRRITDGCLKEGAPIRQDEIAHAIGISKIPVREALSRLRSEGIVILTPNLGATVAVLEVTDYIEMLDMRIALECRALELAVPNMAISDLRKADRLLEEYDHAMKDNEWSDLNMKFHECLYAPANRPRLLKMINSVQDHMGRMLRLKVSEIAGHERSHNEHALIVKACKEGNTRLAVKILRQHIENTQKEIQGAFRHTSSSKKSSSSEVVLEPLVSSSSPYSD